MNLAIAIRLMAAAVILLAGCSSSSGTAAQKAPGSGAPSGNSLPHSTATATISDPSFNGMTAETLTIPSGWKLEGIIMTAPCTSLPWPVFRSYAADGLTEMREMPAVGWRWGPSARAYNPGGCITLDRSLSAVDFLNYYVGTLVGGVHIVGSIPVAPFFSQWAQNFANTANNSGATLYAAARFQTSADTAALRVQTRNGSFIIEQRLTAVVMCRNNNNPGPLMGGDCWARIDVLRAPQGKLDALARFVDDNQLPKGKPIDAWSNAVLARARQQGQAGLAAMNNMQQAAAQTFQQMHQQFMSSMQRNNDNFRAQQESQFNHFMANQAANQQARDNSVSDWVDFALDRQTVTGQGGTAHVSSQYTQTWSSTVGNETQWYQTNDPNANPNGTLYGNWTQDTKVHGNGQPY